MKVQTTWVYSEKTEAERLLQIAHQISVGFYRVNNFIVLPFNPKIQNAHTVTFPDLPYNNIPRFWEQVKKIDVSESPMRLDPKLVNQVIKLSQKANLPVPDYAKIQKTWQKAESEILAEIYKIIPSKKNLIKKIVIYSTSFGTSSSFNIFGKDRNDGVIGINLRSDQGIHAIAESILSSINYLDITEKLDGIWSEAELLVDWLVARSSLSQVLQKYEKPDGYTTTIKGIRTKQQAKLLKESEEFYKDLGIPGVNKPFGLNGLTPEINKKPVKNLNFKEKVVLKKLIENSNSVVSFDAIADNFSDSDENFSLYAISKTIQRLRNKLETNGISGSYIQTLRGQGYLLKN